MPIPISDIVDYYYTRLEKKSPSDKLTILIEKVDEVADSYSEDSLDIDELNELYWQLVAELVNYRVGQGSLGGLNFSESERLLIDFGYLDERFFSFSEEKKQALLAEADYRKFYKTKEKNEKAFCFLTEWLNESYLQLIKVDEKNELEKREKEIIHFLESLPATIIQLQERRNESQLDSRYAGELSLLSVRIEACFSQFFTMKKKIDLGGKLTREENQEFVRLRQLISETKAQKVPLLRDLARTGEDVVIDNLDREIEDSFSKKVDLEGELIEVREAIQRNDEAREALITESKENKGLFVKDLERFREWSLKSATRASNKKPNSVLLEERSYLSKKLVKELVYATEEFDPKLFLNSKTAKEGKPLFIILPGNGYGIYEKEVNSLIIPFLSYGSEEEAIVQGLVDYKVEADEKDLLKQKYYELRPDLKRFGPVYFKNAFVKDYLNWILSESKGRFMMKKKEKAWFENEIAPETHEIRVPGYLREDLKSRDGVKLLLDKAKDALQRKEDLFEANLIMGLLSFFIFENKAALEYFQKAVDLSPKSLIAIYDLALVYEIVNKQMRTKREETIKLWQNYINVDPGGFWRSNALKRVERIKKRVIEEKS